ncbi:hypothetical protein OCO53_25625 [Peribacillus frigoritolerans]|uniref:hypothetical protein n=1 Tax=Peribacillus frigoritolerans TaxID=450367 RepID=UPI0021D3E59F|nr:hypothetical protein [Peribacillus frigoritolerans]MCU6603824.1 hypothetical protein [Peribacillus frigoritolerans]
MKNVEQEFINMISLKQQELAQLNARMEKSAMERLDDQVEKYIDLHQEYTMTQNNDFSQDYREIDSDWSMTDGEKNEAYEDIEKLVDYQEKRGEVIENEMAAILTKEFMPPYPVSDIDIQQDGDLYYVGRQININGEWLPYTNDSNQHFDNKDEAIKMFANMKVDEITNKIGIDLPPLVPNNEPILINQNEIESKIFGKTFMDEKSIPEQFSDMLNQPQFKVNRQQAEELLEKHFQNLPDKNQYEYSKSRFDEKENELTRGYDHITGGGYDKKTLTVNLATLEGIEETRSITENDAGSWVPEIDKVSFQLEVPTHEMISDLKLLESSSGFYVGREQFDAESFEWQPHSRVSEYMPDQQHAEQLFEECNRFKAMIKDMKPGFVETIKVSLMDEIESDPYQINLKVNLINDSLEHDMEPTMEQTIIEEIER